MQVHVSVSHGDLAIEFRCILAALLRDCLELAVQTWISTERSIKFTNENKRMRSRTVHIVNF